VKLFNLKEQGWRDTQLVYHALAYEGIEALVISSPVQNYMCLGLHQHPLDELDMDYCQEHDIGIFRREIGGGTVFLNNDQIFYNLILKRDREGVPHIPENFFKKYLGPVVNALGDIGVRAEYRPLCDLLVNDRKISGNGGGELGECMVLAGGLLLDFDIEAMAGAMALSDEMRSSFLDKMKENLTTLETELGIKPKKAEVIDSIIKRYEEMLGPLEPATLDEAILAKMRELDARYSSDEWFLQRGARSIGREVKVREGVFLFCNEYSTSSGSLTVHVESADNNIIRVSVSGSGDTTSSKVEDSLLGLEYDKRAIEKVVLSCIGGKDNA